jgi:hypothetical protein
LFGLIEMEENGFVNFWNERQDMRFRHYKFISRVYFHMEEFR